MGGFSDQISKKVSQTDKVTQQPGVHTENPQTQNVKTEVQSAWPVGPIPPNQPSEIVSRQDTKPPPVVTEVKPTKPSVAATEGPALPHGTTKQDTGGSSTGQKETTQQHAQDATMKAEQSTIESKAPAAQKQPETLSRPSDQPQTTESQRSRQPEKAESGVGSSAESTFYKQHAAQSQPAESGKASSEETRPVIAAGTDSRQHQAVSVPTTPLDAPAAEKQKSDRLSSEPVRPESQKADQAKDTSTARQSAGEPAKDAVGNKDEGKSADAAKDNKNKASDIIRKEATGIESKRDTTTRLSEQADKQSNISDKAIQATKPTDAKVDPTANMAILGEKQIGIGGGGGGTGIDVRGGKPATDKSPGGAPSDAATAKAPNSGDATLTQKTDRLHGGERSTEGAPAGRAGDTKLNPADRSTEKVGDRPQDRGSDGATDRSIKSALSQMGEAIKDGLTRAQTAIDFLSDKAKFIPSADQSARSVIKDIVEQTKQLFGMANELKESRADAAKRHLDLLDKQIEKKQEQYQELEAKIAGKIEHINSITKTPPRDLVNKEVLTEIPHELKKGATEDQLKQYLDARFPDEASLIKRLEKAIDGDTNEEMQAPFDEEQDDEHRQQYTTKYGDTIRAIARDRLNDPNLARLICQRNPEVCRFEDIDEPLPHGIKLSLPNQADIQAYRKEQTHA